MSIPIVSVIMITYKHDAFILDAVSSILNQNSGYKFELIIADDFPESTIEDIIFKEFKSHPKKNCIRYYKHAVNKGMQENFYWALLQAKGKYIAFCEGDDYWTDNNKLEIQVNFLKINHKYVICSHDIKAIDLNGVRLPQMDLHQFHKSDISQKDLILANKYPFLNSVCCRNLNITFPNEYFYSFSPDAFLFSLLGNYGACKWLGDEIGPSVYRIHEGGVWSMKSDKEKEFSNFSTYFWLYSYYKRIDSTFASSWYNKLIECLAGWGTIQNISILEILDHHQRLKLEILEIKNGYSYKIGRIISYPFRTLIKYINGH